MKVISNRISKLTLENEALKRKCGRYHKEVEEKMDEIAELKRKLKHALEEIERLENGIRFLKGIAKPKE